MAEKGQLLNVQRRLSAEILKCGLNRIRFDPDNLDDIGDAVTKSDIRSLIRGGAISKRKLHNTSRYWAKIRHGQKSKGKQKGFGSRKGKKTARLNPKQSWMNRIRLQRDFIKSLRDKGAIDKKSYHELYMKSKGGFFRSLRHIKLYTNEKGLISNERK